MTKKFLGWSHNSSRTSLGFKGLEPATLKGERLFSLLSEILLEMYLLFVCVLRGFPGGSNDKESACNVGDLGSIPGLWRSLEKGMATHSSILAWKTPWTEESRGLWSMRSQRVRHDWGTHIFTLSGFSCVQLFATLWTVAHQAPQSMGFSRQEYWSGLPCPPPGDLPHQGIELMSIKLAALASRFFTTSTTWGSYSLEKYETGQPCIFCHFLEPRLIDKVTIVEGEKDPVYLQHPRMSPKEGQLWCKPFPSFSSLTSEFNTSLSPCPSPN